MTMTSMNHWYRVLQVMLKSGHFLLVWLINNYHSVALLPELLIAQKRMRYEHYFAVVAEPSNHCCQILHISRRRRPLQTHWLTGQRLLW